MEILNSILIEELERLRKLKKHYEQEISKLPKGCLVRKKIKGHLYYYLNYREGKKGVFKYLGKLNNKELGKLEEKISERRKLRKLEIQVKRDIPKLEKIAHGQKK